MATLEVGSLFHCDSCSPCGPQSVVARGSNILPPPALRLRPLQLGRRLPQECVHPHCYLSTRGRPGQPWQKSFCLWSDCLSVCFNTWLSSFTLVAPFENNLKGKQAWNNNKYEIKVTCLVLLFCLWSDCLSVCFNTWLSSFTLVAPFENNLKGKHITTSMKQQQVWNKSHMFGFTLDNVVSPPTDRQYWRFRSHSPQKPGQKYIIMENPNKW